MASVSLDLPSGRRDLPVGMRLLADIEAAFPGKSYVEALNGLVMAIRDGAPGGAALVISFMEIVIRRAGAPAEDIDRMAPMACGEIVGRVVAAIVEAEGPADSARPREAAAPPSVSAA